MLPGLFTGQKAKEYCPLLAIGITSNIPVTTLYIRGGESLGHGEHMQRYGLSLIAVNNCFCDVSKSSVVHTEPKVSVRRNKHDGRRQKLSVSTITTRPFMSQYFATSAWLRGFYKGEGDRTGVIGMDELLNFVGQPLSVTLCCENVLEFDD
jgi:hypothetical protein